MVLKLVFRSASMISAAIFTSCNHGIINQINIDIIIVLQVVDTAAGVTELVRSRTSSAVPELTASVTMTATLTARRGSERTSASISSLSSLWFLGGGWSKRSATLLKTMIKKQRYNCNVIAQRQQAILILYWRIIIGVTRPQRTVRYTCMFVQYTGDPRLTLHKWNEFLYMNSHQREFRNVVSNILQQSYITAVC